MYLTHINIFINRLIRFIEKFPEDRWTEEGTLYDWQCVALQPFECFLQFFLQNVVDTVDAEEIEVLNRISKGYWLMSDLLIVD